MTHLPPLETKLMIGQQTQVYDGIVFGPRGQVRGSLAAWQRQPDFAWKAQKLGQYFQYKLPLPACLSELSALTTARNGIDKPPITFK